MVSGWPDSVTALHSGSDTTLTGRYIRRNIEQSTSGISGITPVFVCATADAVPLVEEETITINGTSLVIKEIDEKSNGLSVMLLEDV